jgi:hypothetical protein
LRIAQRLFAVVTAAAALAVSAISCAHHAPAPSRAMPPPAAQDLPRPDAIPGVFTARQRITARSAQGGGAFEAVLQKKPGELLLVGLTPFGSRAFVLRQTGKEVAFTSYIQRDLPFPPAYILLDIHRVLDVWLGAPLPDGERIGQVGGERIRERWRGGVLVARTFTQVAGGPHAEPPGDVTVTYAGVGPAGLPASVRVVNARFGYSLTIETLPLR